MSSREVIENKISFIQRELASARGAYGASALDDLVKNRMVRGSLERDLYVIAQAVIDLAEAVVAYKRFRKPTTMREAFDILAEQRVLSPEFVDRFHKIVGFRNILAHGYEAVSPAVLYDVLQNKLGEVEEFLNFIREHI